MCCSTLFLVLFFLIKHMKDSSSQGLCFVFAGLFLCLCTLRTQRCSVNPAEDPRRRHVDALYQILTAAADANPLNPWMRTEAGDLPRTASTPARDVAEVRQRPVWRHRGGAESPRSGGAGEAGRGAGWRLDPGQLPRWGRRRRSELTKKKKRSLLV